MVMAVVRRMFGIFREEGSMGQWDGGGDTHLLLVLSAEESAWYGSQRRMALVTLMGRPPSNRTDDVVPPLLPYRRRAGRYGRDLIRR